MTGDARYQRHVVVEVDAAVVGVSRRRWEGIDREDAEEALRRMAAERFDVLPLDRSGEPVREAYRTEVWGTYGAVRLVEVGDDERLPYTTPIRDVVRWFAEGPERRFAFLEDERGETTGLITVANLNCSQARIWLYALIVELEVTLANLLQKERLDDDVLVRLVPAAAVGQRIQDRLDGTDRSLTEYLYLSNLVNVIAKRGLFGAIGYAARRPFETAFGRLNEVRHLVAHPVRSLVEHPADVRRLWEAVQTAETALERLDAHRPWSADARGGETG